MNTQNNSSTRFLTQKTGNVLEFVLDSAPPGYFLISEVEALKCFCLRASRARGPDRKFRSRTKIPFAELPDWFDARLDYLVHALKSNWQFGSRKETLTDYQLREEIGTRIAKLRSRLVEIEELLALIRAARAATSVPQ